MKSWDELRLYAAESPDAGGVMISAPFVRDAAEHIYRVIDVTAEAPVVSEALVREEFDIGLRNGAWRLVPNLPAQRGRVAVVTGRALMQALITAGIDDDLDFRALDFGWCFAYVHPVAAVSWVEKSGRQLLEWSERSFQNYLRTGLPGADLCNGVAHHAVSLTREGTSDRRRAYVLLGAIGSQLDPHSLAVVSEMASEEFGLTEQDFEAEVYAAIHGLSPRLGEQLAAAGQTSSPPPIFSHADAERSTEPIADLEDCLAA
jgi:hypothetical protein